MKIYKILKINSFMFFSIIFICLFNFAIKILSSVNIVNNILSIFDIKLSYIISLFERITFFSFCIFFIFFSILICLFFFKKERIEFKYTKKFQNHFLESILSDDDDDVKRQKREFNKLINKIRFYYIDEKHLEMKVVSISNNKEMKLFEENRKDILNYINRLLYSDYSCSEFDENSMTIKCIKK